MPRRKESFFDLLAKLPWWISAILGTGAFIALRWGGFAWAGNDQTRRSIAESATTFAPLALVLFGAASVTSFLSRRKHRLLVDRQSSLESLRQVHWKEFELLVAEAYRRRGFRVEYSLGRSADGGVDLVLHQNGRTVLVQCKQWKAYSVGVKVVREMFGLMHAEKADGVVVVSSGEFTPEARSFANGKPIELVNGQELLALVQSVQKQP